MKRLITLFFIVLIAGCTMAQEYDLNFFSKCKSGQTLEYYITSETEPYTVELIGYNDRNLVGKLLIPSSVIYCGKTYSVTSINTEAFYWCRKLSSVTIPNSVTSIGDRAFENCTKLTSVTIPNSVTNIGEHAFYICSRLKSVTIGNSVANISNNAFNGCLSLIDITVEQGNPVYDSRDNSNAIIETETNTLIVGCQNTIIPNTVTRIGAWAFSDCGKLTSIAIPNSVTSIGQAAFYGCDELISIVIPNSVTKIEEGAFTYCSRLTSIVIPDSVTEIGNGAFWGCENLEDNIVEIIEKINSNAFRIWD